MANKKRLIDANAFLSAMIKRFHCVPLIGRNDYDCETLKQMLIEAPTVDAVEVVRCKDCKKLLITGTGRYLCGRTASVMGGITVGGSAVSTEHFCSYGERKDNERTY